MEYTLNDVLDFIQKTTGSKEFTFSFTNSQQIITLNPGIYSLECWGASGMNFGSREVRGKGAYTFGKIRIDSKRKFFIFLGQKGTYFAGKPFGGGGWGDFAGGGASDVRLIGGGDFESLKSRIIVAAGGGGADSTEDGGSGGSLIGIDSRSGYSKGATQTEPGTGYHNGEFGIGGGNRSSSDNNGGGGGGYYGGGSGKEITNFAGSGGSSFISGHPGCDAIYQNSTKEKIYHTGRPFHYSGFTFFDTFMTDGDSEMPGITETTQVGNIGNGFVRIRLISKYLCHEITCKRKVSFQITLIATAVLTAIDS